MAKLVYLIRHGETTGDIEDRYGGAYDDHLSDRGVRQVKSLAEKISSSGIQKIFVSSLIRARKTANILNEKLKVDVESIPGIRERNLYGVLSGMVRSDAKEKFPKLVEKLSNYRNTIKGAESYDVSRRRMIKAFKKTLKSKERIIAIVTHGGPIKTIFREFLRMEVETVSDCGYSVLETVNGEVKLLKTSGITFK
jgi:broad specificity phosphatase PhoE